MVAVEEVCGCARGWEGPHVAMDSTWIPQDLENELLCGGQISQNISGFHTHNQLVQAESPDPACSDPFFQPVSPALVHIRASPSRLKSSGLEATSQKYLRSSWFGFSTLRGSELSIPQTTSERVKELLIDPFQRKFP